MTRPSWLGRVVRNRHRHAIEQASRRWRGGRRDDAARTRRKILISTQVDAGHLVANSIILLVLGSPLEMAHGPIVGVAFEAGVVLGAVASLVFAPYQRVVGFSAGVYCVLGVHFGHLLLHWADICVEIKITARSC